MFTLAPPPTPMHVLCLLALLALPALASAQPHAPSAAPTDALRAEALAEGGPLAEASERPAPTRAVSGAGPTEAPLRPEAPAARPRRAPGTPAQVGMVVAGAYAGAAGVAGGAWAGQRLTRSDTGAIVGGALLAPVGVAAGAYAVGRLAGADGSFGATLRGAAVGGAIGLGVGAGAALALNALAGPPDEAEPDFLSEGFLRATLLVGVVAGSVGVGAVAGGVRGYVRSARAEVRPVSLRLPEGGRVTGLGFRVGL